MSAAATHVDEVPVMSELTASDRCDVGNCTAQAYVRVEIAGMELVFCAHHYRESEVSLATKGAKVVSDQRSELDFELGALV